ncbi:DUF4389 domain-containing protein [Phytohabitans houttuyneae]|uniref:DUF4389 domain-containing protein n=1 Tax=Phytohabitans houttuyneae TaxID=1076126 RepID=UPI0031EEA0E4
MRAGRIVAVVVGAVLAVVGLAAVAGGGALMAVHAVARDGAGYYQSPTERVDTPTAALAARLELGADLADEVVPERPVGTLRVRAESVDGSALFVGVAPTRDVDRWLAGTAYERVDQVRYGPFRTETHLVAGDEPAGAPAGQAFWVATATGAGSQELTWPSERGDWTVVLMNADGRTGVAADVSVGAKTGVLLPLGAALAVAGLPLLAAGVVIMLIALKGTAPPDLAADREPAVVPGSYPVRLDGHLDAGLSRWLWLVKWLLVLPHLFVLALLWLAFVPLTIVAGVAILFTARYPRAIFDFNVGVLRWTWRVCYYGYSALATDRYPPFSLASDPAYPADLTVAYPQRLSPGLVLVKWWLLAIPHYIVVALFTGGWAGGWGWQQDQWRVAAGGLVGVLVVVAAVVLLFSGRYPQPIFDFVMGMNRWCYRVFAYAALMRDEYPPFRLDGGGTDPGTAPVASLPGGDGGGGVLVGSAPGGAGR